MTKTEAPTEKQADSPLAIAAMVLGVLSLTGPGLLLGIPAIIIASVALKRKEGGRGLSIAGLVTGIVSTVVSLVFLMFLALAVVWIMDHPQEFEQYQSPQLEESFESLKA